MCSYNRDWTMVPRIQYPCGLQLLTSWNRPYVITSKKEILHSHCCISTSILKVEMPNCTFAFAIANCFRQFIPICSKGRTYLWSWEVLTKGPLLCSHDHNLYLTTIYWKYLVMYVGVIRLPFSVEDMNLNGLWLGDDQRANTIKTYIKEIGLRLQIDIHYTTLK